MEAVSIIITNYNYGRFLERAIRSCLDQKLVDVEVVVVDDASTDSDTPHVLSAFADNPRVRIISLEENSGVAKASNIGIRAAANRFIVRVDSDDFVSQLMCFFLSEFLKANPSAFGVACDYFLTDTSGDKLERVSSVEKPISCGVMYRKDDMIEAGLYGNDWRYREEEELRARLKEKYDIIRIPMPLYRYVRHGDNKTLHTQQMTEAEKELECVKKSSQM